jgi:hypothetical protein
MPLTLGQRDAGLVAEVAKKHRTRRGRRVAQAEAFPRCHGTTLPAIGEFRTAAFQAAVGKARTPLDPLARADRIRSRETRVRSRVRAGRRGLDFCIPREFIARSRKSLTVSGRSGYNTHHGWQPTRYSILTAR